MFYTALFIFIIGDCVKNTLKQKYLTSAFILLFSTVIVKIISAVYKIPLTGYIGAEGRGYFSIAYNLCMPVHAITMGAFPLALTKLVSSYEAKGDKHKVKALRIASKKLFFIIGIIGMGIMLLLSKPYCELISSSPKSIYTILALAPSVFFSCLCACHRSFAEGYMDMKPTAVSQLLEALFKMIFGLLFARYSMSWLYEVYILNGKVLGADVSTEQEALSAIYPLTSAAAIFGVTLGSIAAYIFAMIYTNSKYNNFPRDRVDAKLAYNELLIFSASLVGATVVQSISNFVDTSSIQYFLSLCNESSLKALYSYNGDDVYTYVFGIYAAILDFKNLVPSIVMALGVTAVPAVSSAYENSSERFSSLLTSIFKYSSILSITGGLLLSCFSREILGLFYYSSNPDIVENGSNILFYMGVTILPCALATTTVYATQALGFAKTTIPVFAVSCVLRVVVNYLLIPNSDINILGTALSNFAGFFVIVVMNIVTIRKKTKAKISYINVLVKPVLCGFLSYFAITYIKMHISMNIYESIMVMLVCPLFYFTMLIVTKTIVLKGIRKS